MVSDLLPAGEDPGRGAAAAVQLLPAHRRAAHLAAQRQEVCALP